MTRIKYLFRNSIYVHIYFFCLIYVPSHDKCQYPQVTPRTLYRECLFPPDDINPPWTRQPEIYIPEVETVVPVTKTRVTRSRPHRLVGPTIPVDRLGKQENQQVTKKVVPTRDQPQLYSMFLERYRHSKVTGVIHDDSLGKRSL